MTQTSADNEDLHSHGAGDTETKTQGLQCQDI